MNDSSFIQFFPGPWVMNHEFLTQIKSIQLFCNFYVYLIVLNRNTKNSSRISGRISWNSRIWIHQQASERILRQEKLCLGIISKLWRQVYSHSHSPSQILRLCLVLRNRPPGWHKTVSVRCWWKVKCLGNSFKMWKKKLIHFNLNIVKNLIFFRCPI